MSGKVHIARKVRFAAAGRWEVIFSKFFPSLRSMVNDNAKESCPLCAEHKMRYAHDSVDGTFFCACVTHIRGFDMFSAMSGVSFQEAVNTIGDYLESGTSEVMQDHEKLLKVKERSIREKRNRALRWNKSLVADAEPIRYAPDVIYNTLVSWGWDGESHLGLLWKVVPVEQFGSWEKLGYREQPCILALIKNKFGKEVSTQILSPDGVKTQTYYTEETRQIYIDLWGKPTRRIAEGLKTSLAASSLFGVKVTPVLDAAHMPRYHRKCKALFADNDKAGRKAANDYCKRNNIKSSKIKKPPSEGEDWYDVFQKTESLK